MLFKLALANIKGNRRRTIITTALSAFSTMLFIFYVGFLKGSFVKLYDDSLQLYSGYIQIVGKGYVDNPDFEHLIYDEAKILRIASSHPDVAFASARFESFGLYATSMTAYGAQFSAVYPQNEPRFTKLPRYLDKGRYLEAHDTTGVVIGAGLAERLHLDVGQSMSIITTGVDYAFAADNLEVVGIIKTYMTELDESMVFMNKPYFDTLMSSANTATHIIIEPKEHAQSLRIAAELSQMLKNEPVEVREWHTFLSDLIQLEQVKILSGGTIISLFVLLIFFVVLIYNFLSVQARIKEIGVMRALGTTPFEIFKLFLYETLILGGSSVLVGGAMGGFLIYTMQIHPLELTAFTEMYREYGIIEAVFPTQFSWGYVAIGMSYIFVLNILTILYPAWTVIRIRPIEGIHHL